jgi:tetratricopeptide (TPR) repeat protein
MAKVSLRIYNREIETMVDRGQLDEAISHCRHILNVFPKHLETYRLLGKAYLEARRYSEATDIFQRVLMAVPDDFVSHVGMSIISDEQNDMDAAIWHMERAFEVQPSNAAIQAELQRLFGRRDGVEPPKIRLTRGALAHMYIQGELYPQAIAEINAVLEEDRERQDMQVLLARAYFHGGQKNEAAGVCAQLLRRYPYCLDANRVLIELLPESEKGESPQVYRNRVNELDPYATFTTGSVFHTEEAPDAAVSLDRLDWDGQPVDLGHEWKDAQGIGLTSQKPADDEQPDWLKSGLTPGSFSASVPSDEPAPVYGSDDDIPDFLREAGWGKDSGTFQEDPGVVDSSEEITEEPTLEEGDLPDWIKAMAPTGTDIGASAPQEEDLTQDDVPDWLQGLGSAQDMSLTGQTMEEGDVPDWLAAMKPESDTPQEEQPQDEVLAEPTSEADLPDWIAAMKSEGVPQQDEQLQEEFPAEPASDSDLPDWLADMKPEGIEAQEEQPAEEMTAETTGEDDLPDWISALKSEDAASQESQPEEAAATEPIGEEDLPDWIAALKPETVAPQEERPAEEMTAQQTGEDDLPDWIAALKPAGGEPQEEQPEESVIAEPTGDDDLPDWLRSVQAEEDKFAVQQASADVPEEPVQEFPEVSGESLSDWQIGDEEVASTVTFDATDTGALGTTAAEQDDAIAWLESLAAKHGAKPEELVTDPNARKETAPDWVQQARAVKEQESVEPPVSQEEPLVEPSAELPDFEAEARVEPGEATSAGAVPIETGAPVPSAEEQDDAIAWLESLAAKHGAKAEELVTDPNARKDTAPEWVQRAAEAGSAAQLPAKEEAPPEEPAESIPEWIEAAKEEAGSLYDELEDTQPREPVKPAADETGVWLRDLETEAGVKGDQEPAAEPEASAMGLDDDGTPDWLRELEGEMPQASPPVEGSAQEVPDWLSSLDAEPSQEETEPAPEEETSEVPDWLSEIKADASVLESTPTSEEERQGVPDWLQEAEQEPSGDKLSPLQEEVSEADASPASEESVSEEIPDWLSQVEHEPAEPVSYATPPSDEGEISEPEQADEFRPVEAAAESTEPDFTDWLKSIDAKDTEAEVSETPAEETASEDLPSWLAGLEEEEAQQEAIRSTDEDLPAWLRGMDEQKPVLAEPTAPTDWHPAEVETPAVEEPAREPVMEEPSVEVTPPPPSEPVSKAEPEPAAPPERERYVEPVTRSRSGMTGMLSSAQDPLLTQAQLELTRGNVSGALDNYGKLIRKGKMLDEIIFDLREAQYRFPVDVSIMQALGDAYMRANRLQDALDAYTKAEELLR